MKNKKRIGKILLIAASYLLVAAIFMGIGWLVRSPWSPKLQRLEALIQERFIGDVDQTTLEDGAAAGMVAAMGDRWSYYIPASQYEAHKERNENAYVGIGVTINTEDTQNGFLVIKLEPNGGAKEAGLLPNDLITHVDGASIAEIGSDAATEKIRGEEGTQVKLTVLRDGQQLEFSVTRQRFLIEVARGELLEGNVGLVTIHNFVERCADETLAAVKSVMDQGATALIFDVRNNGGGYKDEMVKILDYLLPEGALFRSVSYDGTEEVDKSDADCLKIPMAVLINGNSYSAAEFFAAALSEYQWATVVGEPTSGKSHFQNTFPLGDGSAVCISVGKYCTPNGVSLADVGGLKPDVVVELDEETANKLYSDSLPPMEDPQVLAAIEALK